MQCIGVIYLYLPGNTDIGRLHHQYPVTGKFKTSQRSQFPFLIQVLLLTFLSGRQSVTYLTCMQSLTATTLLKLDQLSLNISWLHDSALYSGNYGQWCIALGSEGV